MESQPPTRSPVRVVKLRLRDVGELKDALRHEGHAGGMFLPTTTPLKAGEEIVAELAAPFLPNKVLIRGEVRSWRQAVPRLRIRAGAEVRFLAAEKPKRDFLLACLGGAEGTRQVSPKRRHARLPVDVPVRYRLPGRSDGHDSLIREISAGGALLVTPGGLLPLETEVILEIRPPGTLSALEVAGRVSYHAPPDGTGLRFVYRDGGGSRRLREVVRRLRKG